MSLSENMKVIVEDFKEEHSDNEFAQKVNTPIMLGVWFFFVILLAVIATAIAKIAITLLPFAIGFWFAWKLPSGVKREADKIRAKKK